MFPINRISNKRNFAIEEFSVLRMKALRDSVLERIFRRKNCLLDFPEKVRADNANRKLLPIKDIPIEKIVGTLGRGRDFDGKFRPLKNHLKDRWANIFTAYETEGWPPIIVHKVGEYYYVEDGHHRISVARSIGRAFISAEVWEYSNGSTKVNDCPTMFTSSCSHFEACPE
jgi:hypothetical protein